MSGADFYAAPRLSPDGRQLAWLSWNHPNMPWDGTTLWLAGIAADGVLTGSRRVAGGADISAFQPEWSPDGTFHFVDDSTGWWNLYCLRNDAPEALCPRQAEFGLPLWQFGMKSFGFLADGRLVCRVIEDGVGRLATITQDRLETIATPFSHAGLPQSLGGRLALIGATRSEPPRLSLWDPDTNTEEVLKRATGSAVDPGYVSQAEAITFPTADGLLAHAFYYPPHNRDHGAPAGELPPLIVRSHGGPHGGHQRRLFLGHPVLDQPRLRRRRRELRRQHRLMGAPIGGAWRGAGASSTWRTASMPPGSLPNLAGRTRTA